MKGKNWSILVITGTLVILGVFAGITVYIDPLFHYHAPLEKYAYPLNDERYQNDGIVKHFDYDAVITGSSMCENFPASEFDTYWNTKSIKVALAGGTFYEADRLVRLALERNPKVRYVLRSLDYSAMIQDKDALFELELQPEYLYDENPFNDAPYLLNKEMLVSKVYDVIHLTHIHGETTSFDEYAYWSRDAVYGAEAVFGGYEWEDTPCAQQPLTDEEYETLMENVRQNIVETANAYPDVTFYYFITPYSIGYWNMLFYRGELNKYLTAEKYMIEELLKCPNIKLYSFTNNFALTCDMDNYMDLAHFGSWVNRGILYWMYCDEYRLTEENYENYCAEVLEFYSKFDYSSLR